MGDHRPLPEQVATKVNLFGNGCSFVLETELHRTVPDSLIRREFRMFSGLPLTGERRDGPHWCGCAIVRAGRGAISLGCDSTRDRRLRPTPVYREHHRGRTRDLLRAARARLQPQSATHDGTSGWRRVLTQLSLDCGPADTVSSPCASGVMVTVPSQVCFTWAGTGS